MLKINVLRKYSSVNSNDSKVDSNINSFESKIIEIFMVLSQKKAYQAGMPLTLS